jgi:4-oxalocrotonate tautomerase
MFCDIGVDCCSAAFGPRNETGVREMPHVTVTVIGNAPTQEQKSALFSKISNLLVTVLGPARKLTLVSVRTEPAANWSVGGDQAEDTGLVGVEAVIRTVAGSSVEKRARMIGETTTVLREVLGTPILPLFVVMEEIAPESWGYDGKTIAQIRADKNK